MKWIKRIFAKRPEPTPEAMIKILLDQSGEFGDRDDVAMDLSRYDEPAVEDALIKVVTDPNEDENLADSASESLWEIWQRQQREPPLAVVEKMPAAVRKRFNQ